MSHPFLGVVDFFFYKELSKIGARGRIEVAERYISKNVEESVIEPQEIVITSKRNRPKKFLDKSRRLVQIRKKTQKSLLRDLQTV